MVASYVHHIAAWMDGTESLPDGEYRAYHVICELIYLNNGPIVLHESGIAGRCNQHVLAFRRNLAKLIERHKLMLGADGKLSNKRAESELRTRIKPQTNLPSTPARPPPDPVHTPATPPPSVVSKSLKSGKSSHGSNDCALTVLSSESSSENPKGKKVRAESKSKGERLPPDWKPNPAHYAKGIERGFSVPVIDYFADKMRNWAVANDHRPVTRKSNWDAAFSNWIDDRSERNGVPNGRANGRLQKVDPIAAAAARVFGGGGRGGAASGATGPVPPADRMGDQQNGTGRREEPAFDLDLRPEPGSTVRSR